MQYVMFTKHLQGLEIPDLIKALKSVGVEGADLCVREGYPVTPDNIEQALPQAVQQFAAEGLCIPLVTAPGDLNRPDIDYAERYYEACGKAGVKHIKLGYWSWTPEKHYWDQIEEIRGHVAEFESLSRTYGVQTVIHTHSGASIALNACAAMDVVQGFDPRHIGVFADPGHLSVCGEPVEMALDIVRDFLSVVALKDLIQWRPLGRPGQGSRIVGTTRMGEGFVDWPAVAKTLQGLNFSGPISFHSEYDEPAETVIDLARIDVRFFNDQLAATD